MESSEIPEENRLIVERTKVTEKVLEYLKENITDGSWKVGEKIPSENQLTMELGVSRASVRAAIGQLIGIGVLESMHGKGTYLKNNVISDAQNADEIITAQDCSDARKVLEFRQLLEPAGCRLAAENQTPDFIRELEKTLQKMQSSKEINSEKFIKADMEFHKLIAAQSGNPLLAKSLTRVFQENIRNHRQMNMILGFESGLFYHKLILEKIRERKPEEAEKCMYEHLERGIEDLNHSLEE